MDKVTYLLGAGFSAPLGLPVMSNFRLKSQDMYWHHPERYSHFGEVFKTLERMSQSKNFYSVDLYNIEEILSIFEMGSYVHGKVLEEHFLQYIRDVISFFTPPFEPYEGSLPGNWEAALFGANKRDNKWRMYSCFVGSLFRLCFGLKKVDARRSDLEYQDIVVSVDPNPSTSYSVITLNYDLVLETACDFYRQKMKTKEQFEFIRDQPQDLSVDSMQVRGVPLAKLHGSIDSEGIVPPTWNKSVTPTIATAWKLAFQELATAKHIRVIGYSLPTADAYVKYLLKAAAVDNPYLKSIDVICRDRDGSVRHRYEEFITFNYFRFVSGTIEDYLIKLLEASNQALSQGMTIAQLNFGIEPLRCLNCLEQVHENFMRAHYTN